jgi:hypothetical protein
MAVADTADGSRCLRFQKAGGLFHSSFCGFQGCTSQGVEGLQRGLWFIRNVPVHLFERALQRHCPGWAQGCIWRPFALLRNDEATRTRALALKDVYILGPSVRLSRRFVTWSHQASHRRLPHNLMYVNIQAMPQWYGLVNIAFTTSWCPFHVNHRGRRRRLLAT